MGMSGEWGWRGLPGSVGHFLARGPVADIESEPTAASGPAYISVPERMRSGVLDRPCLSSDACATLQHWLRRMAQRVLCSKSVEHSSKSEVGVSQSEKYSSKSGDGGSNV